MEQIKQIIKRDGRTVDFDIDKIADAIYKAAQVLGGKDYEMCIRDRLSSEERQEAASEPAQAP